MFLLRFRIEVLFDLLRGFRASRKMYTGRMDVLTL